VEQTPKYALKKPGENDYGDVSVLNENADKLDVALDGLETGKEGLVKNAAEKATPADADSLVLVDSADSSKTKRLTWSNLKAVLKTWFDTLYATVSHTHAWSVITGKPTAFTPTSHAATHKTGGTDALTPGGIGAEVAGAAEAVNINLQNQINDQAIDIATKSAAAAKTVFDVTSQKLRVVRSGIGRFNYVRKYIRAVPTDSTSYNISCYEPAQSNTSLLLDGPLMYFNGKLALGYTCATFNGTAWTYIDSVLILDAETLEVIYTAADKSTSSGAEKPRFLERGVICPLGVGVNWNLGSSGLLLYDSENKKEGVLGGSNSGISRFISTKYWGVELVSSYTSRYLKYGKRVTGTPIDLALSLGNGANSSYYQIVMLGVVGDVLYLYERTAQYSGRLMKITLADTTAESTVVTTEVYSFALTNNPILVKERYVIGYASTATAGGLFVFDLVTGTSNYQTMVLSEANKAFKNVDATGYIGTVGNTMYFLWYPGVITEVNRDTLGFIAQYDAPTQLINKNLSSSNIRCYRETIFENGILIIANYGYDTRTNTAKELLGDDYIGSTSISGSNYYSVYAKYVHGPIVHDGGTIKKPKAVGYIEGGSYNREFFINLAVDPGEEIIGLDDFEE